mmetsp:Transcript_49660/g.130974  ORF Transcript_49660/g.130974 Transcript_49660/m.130974 type:complete len:290 (-) Transcript_49660:728-1597(-)
MDDGLSSGSSTRPMMWSFRTPNRTPCASSTFRLFASATASSSTEAENPTKGMPVVIRCAAVPTAEADGREMKSESPTATAPRCAPRAEVILVKPTRMETSTVPLVGAVTIAWAPGAVGHGWCNASMMKHSSTKCAAQEGNLAPMNCCASLRRHARRSADAVLNTALLWVSSNCIKCECTRRSATYAETKRWVSPYSSSTGQRWSTWPAPPASRKYVRVACAPLRGHIPTQISWWATSSFPFAEPPKIVDVPAGPFTTVAGGSCAGGPSLSLQAASSSNTASSSCKMPCS